ncbi:protein of unknown function [Burkholderia multivorans]
MVLVLAKTALLSMIVPVPDFSARPL